MKNLDYLQRRNFFTYLPILSLVTCTVLWVSATIDGVSGVWWGNDMMWLITLCASLFMGGVVQAGVPQTINPRTGATVGWKDPAQIPATFDAGSLGALSNAQARALVEAMMGVWGEVPTSRAAFAPPSLYDHDITGANVTEFLDGTICTNEFPPTIPAMERGESPIIFDHDGSIIDLLAGQGASRKIVGKAAFRCYEGTIADPSHATQAFAIFNGLFLDGKADPDDLDINVYAGIVLHELGHFLGLHHSMVNETLFEDLLTHTDAVDNSRFIPVMFPLVSRHSLAATVLKPDDIAAISALYPTDNVAGATIAGTIYDSAGTGFRGANVVARRQDDPLCHAVATISGRYCTPLLDETSRLSLLGSGCTDASSARGAFRIDGLAAGEYTVEVSEVTALGGARENMFPKSGDVTLPGPAEFYSDDETDHDATEDKTLLHVDDGAQLPSVDIYLNLPTDTVDKTIAVNHLERRAESDCVSDPVDYGELVTLVEVTPEPALNVAPLHDDVNVAASSGCILMDHASYPDTPRSVAGWGLLGLAGIGLVCLRRGGRVVCLAVMIVGTSASAARAASMLPASPEELASMAGQVFVGTCASVVSRVDQRGLLIYEVTYRVEQMLKGPPRRHVVFRVVSSLVGPNDDGEGNVSPFTVGSRDILFLYPESPWGFTSPVAGAQGRFHIWHDPNGQAVVRNPFPSSPSTPGSAGKSVSSLNASPTISPAQLIDQFQRLMQ